MERSKEISKVFGSDEIAEKVKRSSTFGHRNGVAAAAVAVESGEGIPLH